MRSNEYVYSLCPQGKNFFSNLYSYNFSPIYPTVGEDGFIFPVPIEGMGSYNPAVFKQHNKYYLKDTIVSEEKKITYVPDYNSREQQIAAYDGLRKDLATAIRSSGASELMLGLNDTATFAYQINCPDISRDTVFVSLLTMSVCSVVENKDKASVGESTEGTGSFSNELYNHTSADYMEVLEYDSVKQNLTEKINILPKISSYRLLSSSRTGLYSFDLGTSQYNRLKIHKAELDGNGKVANLKQTTGSIGNSSIINGKVAINNLRLTAGEKHVMTFDMQAGSSADGIKGRYGVIPLSIDFTPIAVSVGDNTLSFTNSSAEYYKFVSTENMYHGFAVDDPSTILELYDSNFNLVSTSTTNTLRTILVKDTTYYIRISSTNNMTKELNLTITSEMNVNYDSKGGTQVLPAIDSSGSPVVLGTSSKSYYTFGGWWSTPTGGVRVDEAYLRALKIPEVTIYASWTPTQYSFTYVENGGSQMTDRTFNIEQSFNLNTNITKSDYVFLGWYNNEGLQGESITSVPIGTVGNKVVFAKWALRNHTVTLDVNSWSTDNKSATIASTSKAVVYGEAFNLPVPTIEGFTFNGWYYGNVKYTNSNGNSLSNYTVNGNINLTANWTREKYYIKIDINGKYKWLTSDGLSDNEAFIQYSGNLCPNCELLKSEYRKSTYKLGSVFKYLVTNPTDTDSIACWQTSSTNLINGTTYTFYPYYILEKYTIAYNDEESNQITKDFVIGDVFNIIPTKKHYNFLRWIISDTQYNKDNLDNTMYGVGSTFNYSSFPDLSLYEEKDKTIFLTAIFEPKTYIIKIIGVPQPYLVEYDTEAKLVPDRKGYSFNGGYTNANLTEMIIFTTGNIDWTKIYDNIIIYPKWIVINYTITMNIGGDVTLLGDGITSVNDAIKTMTYNIETPTFTLPIPDRWVYGFAGWKKSDGVIVSVVNKGTTGDIVVTDSWDGVIYLGSSFSNNSTVTLNSDTTNKGVIIFDMSNKTMTGVTFKISSSIKKIEFKDNSYGINEGRIRHTFSIIVESRSATLKMYLDNIKFAGCFRNAGIDVLGSVSIFTKGNNIVQGGEVMFGEEGKVGIRIQNDFSINNTPNSKLVIQGGTGGNGSGGLYGTEGGTGAAGEWPSVDGKTGGPGSEGRTGEQGRLGGAAIECYSYSYKVGFGTNTYARAGFGGAGGNGGTGGTGGRGGDGAFMVNTGVGGNGGTGGSGGNGGVGAAKSTTVFKGIALNVKALAYDNTGIGGNGGSGGIGGSGGKGGKRWNLTEWYRAGDTGAVGAAGAKGAGAANDSNIVINWSTIN